MKSRVILALAAALATTHAQVPVYGQCGGINYSGSTTCASGSTCTKSNDYYSQCLPNSSGGNNGGAGTTLTTVAVPTSTQPPAEASGNPMAGKSFYANPYYASEISSSAAPTLSAKGSATWAAKATEVAKIGTFVWLDTRAKVPSIETYAKDVQKQNAAGANLMLPLVVYDLPERDCSALASNGELSLANNGATLYQGYIDSIAAQIKAFPDVFFVLVIEPDSLANLVTNLNVQKCANAESAYKTLTVYALKTLNLKNVVMYMDAGHAGWLGWPANIDPAAKLFAQIYSDAGKPAAVRGLATNVANYNAWSISTCPSYTQGNQVCDEKSYINKFAPLLQAQGFPAHFIMDTSRNGVQPTKQQAWGDWCNVIGTGFGIRPTTVTPDPLLDAFVWVKPGGECDGTSNSSAVRYDAHCGYADALQPAPEAGTWFEAYFEQLLVNANPKF
ncbi:putative 1,4-beta-D-glucan cellobiohydrolase C [Lindgomyces ingoldianus]|uniref:1,4-beta-D-glucan cellobiohydrolase C n=1 Tax=Lindgomyces ingoldianus TaxID=673940 RepID=A0ACB6RHS9_9PLEO|nr:putative 1,4-beta-D-glucan cellobiohydrolase C [Lindgomyces ingoldianus]KAF2478328.1 putative 1,4-beta-D-glucan cellobiohydrolase C [Lindgomyces ingoldianus]